MHNYNLLYLLIVHTISLMNIRFDTTKDAKNIQKHDGVSLAEAAEFEWDEAVIWP